MSWFRKVVFTHAIKGLFIKKVYLQILLEQTINSTDGHCQFHCYCNTKGAVSNERGSLKQEGQSQTKGAVSNKRGSLKRL